MDNLIKPSHPLANCIQSGELQTKQVTVFKTQENKYKYKHTVVYNIALKISKPMFKQPFIKLELPLDRKHLK